MLSDIDRAIVLEKTAGIRGRHMRMGALIGGGLGGASAMARASAAGVPASYLPLAGLFGMPVPALLGTGIGAITGTSAKRTQRTRRILAGLAGGGAIAGGAALALKGKKKKAGVIGRRTLIGALLGGLAAGGGTALIGRNAGRAHAAEAAVRQVKTVLHGVERLPPSKFRNSLLTKMNSEAGQNRMKKFIKSNADLGASAGLRKSRYGVGAAGGAFYGGLAGMVSGARASNAAKTKKVRKAMKGVAIGAGGLAAAGGVAAALGSKK